MKRCLHPISMFVLLLAIVAVQVAACTLLYSERYAEPTPCNQVKALSWTSQLPDNKSPSKLGDPQPSLGKRAGRGIFIPLNAAGCMTLDPNGQLYEFSSLWIIVNVCKIKKYNAESVRANIWHTIDNQIRPLIVSGSYGRILAPPEKTTLISVDITDADGVAVTSACSGKGTWGISQDIKDAAIKKAAAQGINVDLYAHVIILGDFTASPTVPGYETSAAGRGEQITHTPGLLGGYIIMQGSLAWNGNIGSDVFFHEWGHNMGLWHPQNGGAFTTMDMGISEGFIFNSVQMEYMGLQDTLATYDASLMNISFVLPQCDSSPKCIVKVKLMPGDTVVEGDTLYFQYFSTLTKVHANIRIRGTVSVHCVDSSKPVKDSLKQNFVSVYTLIDAANLTREFVWLPPGAFNNASTDFEYISSHFPMTGIKNTYSFRFSEMSDQTVRITFKVTKP